MSDNLVERLRRNHEALLGPDYFLAATRIESLEAEIEALRAQFSEYAGENTALRNDLVLVGMEAALEAALAEMWQDINSAPKDWRDVLLYAPDLASDWRCVCEGYFDGDAGRWRSPAFESVNPAHFMPLPAPPSRL